MVARLIYFILELDCLTLVVLGSSVPLYKPSGWPGGLPLGQDGDICINYQLCTFSPGVEQIKKTTIKKEILVK